MPATLNHVTTNFSRIDTLDTIDPAIKDLAKAVRAAMTEDATLVDAWKDLVAKADAARIADKLPGTVGRTYAAKYHGKATRTPRGTKREIALTPAARRALDKYAPASDGTPVGEVLTFTNVRNMVRLLNGAIESSLKDIESPAKASAADRSALKALLRKVEV